MRAPRPHQAFVLAVAVASGVPYREAMGQSAPTEAPTGFDNLTNGFVDQATHDLDGDAFARSFAAAEGLGPVYNARSCRDCHDSPVSGGNSQVPDLRAGHALAGGVFVEHPGGSLVHSRAIDPRIQERVLDGNEVRALRMSISTLGAGFVEAIADATLVAIAASQPGQSAGLVHGQAIMVPGLGGTASRVGRFGWKDQQASLLSMATYELRDQVGITSPLLPTENTSNGTSVQAFDLVPDPEDSGEHAFAAARFIRASKVPPRDELADTPAARQGAAVFNAIGCAICHVPTMTTSPAGTQVGDYVVHPALGNKLIHPYGDFLLHDIGTGDGVAQNGGQGTRNTVRTMPLWGLRTRSRYLHDGSAMTLSEAIQRHGGEGKRSSITYSLLGTQARNSLLAFLRSL